MPDHASFEDAAAASLVFVTAWHSLITRGGLQPGETVLIVGAGGGVNTAAIQIAKLAGADCIYVVGSSAEKLAKQKRWVRMCYSIGTRLIGEKRSLRQPTDAVSILWSITSVPLRFTRRCAPSKRGGRLLTVGNTSGPKFEIDNRLIFGKHLSIIGSTMGSSADYDTVMNLIFNGRLQPVIDTVYPLSESITALNRLDAGMLQATCPNSLACVENYPVIKLIKKFSFFIIQRRI